MQPRIRKLPSKTVISDEARIVALIDRHEFSKVVRLALKSRQLDAQSLLTIAVKIAESNYWGAKFVFEKAFEIGANAPEAYYLYGNYLKNAGKFRKAEELFRKASLKYPELHSIFTELGVVLLLLKKPEEAQVQLRRSVELNPNDAYAWTSLGSALMITGKNDEAEIAHKKSIEVDPEFPISYLNLMHLYEDMGRIEEMKQMRDKVSTLASNLKKYRVKSIIMKN